MRVACITGMNGFVGHHLTDHLLKEDVTVYGMDRSFPPETQENGEGKFVRLQGDLTEDSTIQRIFDIPGLNEIYHLAAISYVPESWVNPSRTLEINTLIPVRMIQAARNRNWRGRFLFVSSSEVYGSLAEGDRPIDESFLTFPETPYSVSKLAAESMIRVLSTNEIQCMIARPFNHIGPGQSNQFVVPVFFRRILDAVEENRETIVTGDLRSGRDFSDVRDVVAAYSTILTEGIAGETYNVCSGKMLRISELLSEMQKICGTNLRTEVDPSLVRKEGSSHRFGSSEKLKSLGWKPAYSLQQSLQDIRAEIDQARQMEKRQ